jgi:hypothetical protein
MFENSSQIFVGSKEPEDNFYALEKGVYLAIKPAEEYHVPETRSIDFELASQWVDAHTTPEGKDLAMKLLDNIKILTFDQFQIDLSEMADGVDSQIQGEDYVLLVDPGRSSEYIASLITPKLKHQPKAILNIASDYYVEMESERLRGVKKVVFLDDGAFSGSQIESYIRNHIRPSYPPDILAVLFSTSITKFC